MMKKHSIANSVWIIILGMLAAFVVILPCAGIPSTPPQNLRVSDIGYESEAGQNWFAGFVELAHIPSRSDKGKVTDILFQPH